MAPQIGPADKAGGDRDKVKLTFKNKVIFLFSAAIVLLIAFITTVFTVHRTIELKRDILNNASNYVLLTTDKIGDAFVHYYNSSYFKFREVMIHQTKLNPDLEEIRIVSPDGKIYYSSREFWPEEIPPGSIKYPFEADSFVIKNLKKLEINQKVAENLTVVAPYLDEYGVHSISIIYRFSLRRLSQSLKIAIRNGIVIAIFFTLLGSLGLTYFANRITVHLRCLQDAAKEIARGDFTRVVTIKTNDEFEDLAMTFNFMTAEIRKNIRELKNLVNELKNRDAQKIYFLANLSHELRTPLTAALGYIDYLQNQKLGPLNQEQLHGLAVIRRNVERLNKEIHSLLQISKVTLEGIKLSPQRFSLREMIDSIITDFQPDIKNKGLKIDCNLQITEVFADRDYLRTAIENLIGNAIKFSETKGEVQIATLNYTEDGKHFFKFVITNQGPEIPRSKLKKIFEPFYQIDTGTARRYGGIGLGLAIARNIIEAHQGKIRAESKMGLTTLEFIIPQGE
uniref:histidine kinase n=1 Tax=candidate division WOR-3 bacterium TaxID=2052148 RepID=A0A7C4TCK3_UNCW3